MTNYIIKDHEQYPIHPEHIDASHGLMDTFDNYETEVSAGWIVRFCQERGSWAPFTREEIEELYHRTYPDSRFLFNRLIEPGIAFGIRTGNYKTGGGWIIEGDDGKLYITHEFVIRCFRSCPSIFASEDKAKVNPL